MKYERLHGPEFRCRECGARGRWLWWWNRRNGMESCFRRYCKKCGRRKGWKFLGYEINGINHGQKRKTHFFVREQIGRPFL